MKQSEREKLRKLRKELGQFEREEPESAHLHKSLNRLVGEDDTLPEEDQNAWQELREDIERYEATHPKLTELLNRIATTLSDMGI